MNHFPNQTIFQTFLLNKKNEIEIIGNPIHNTNLKDLYLKFLTKNNYNNNTKLTTTKPKHSQINLNKVKINETKEFIFKLKNTGKYPLIITEISTSCGCISTTFKKHPIPPKEEQTIKMKAKFKEKGFFSKTVYIKCNIKSPIILTIKGEVIEF